MKTIALMLWAFNLLLTAETVGLEWDASPEPNIARYELYILNPQSLLGTTTDTHFYAEFSETRTVAVMAVAQDGSKSSLSDPLVVSPWDTQDIPKLTLAGSTITASTDGTVGPQGPRNDYHGALAIDESQLTFWHSDWGFSDRVDAIPPHYIQIQLPQSALVSGLKYVPKQDEWTAGNITTYEIQSSNDGITWESWATGTWPGDRLPQFADLQLRNVRYLRLWSFDRYANVAEIVIAGTYAPVEKLVSLQIQSSSDLVTWTNIDHPPIALPTKSKEFFRIEITTPAP